MEKKYSKVNRRNFLKTIGAAGLGSVLASNASAEPNEPNAPKPAEPQQPLPQVPKRKFGKTGIEVPSLCLGAIQVTDHQVVFHSCAKWGVTYWDTAHGYTGGNSELAIGKFIKANPDMRKNLVIATKASRAKTVQEVEERLQTSLQRMSTDYIDVYYGVHGLNDNSQLTDELKTWAENAKKRGVIRYFGFSTHSSVPLAPAAKLGWVDAILVTYNFRLTKDEEMQKAIDACDKAGVALTAMKVQGLKVENESDQKMMDHFTQKGFTPGQAKIKAVLEDQRIASVTVGMTSVALVTENAAAVLDKTKLGVDDKKVLEQYADATCSGYCAGCAHICGAAVPEVACVSEVMRSLMYYNSYGDKEMAKQAFAEIPAEVRAKLLKVDYRAAEARCPQRMPIAKLVAQAVTQLA